MPGFLAKGVGKVDEFSGSAASGIPDLSVEFEMLLFL